MNGSRGGGGADGYTLIELVAVMVIVGILGALALPRFAAVDVFAERGYFEEALAATRYAHKLAVASGCGIRVEFDAGGGRISLARFAGGVDCNQPSVATTPVARPGSADPFTAVAPAGVQIDRNLAFYFDRVGRPHDLAGALHDDPAQLTVGIGGRRLQVTPDTGLVREL